MKVDLGFITRWQRDPQSPWFVNCGSPSSTRKAVRKIETAYVKDSACRILDIGGTENGFVSRLTAAPQANVILVNPKGKPGSYDKIGSVPPYLRFDLIMMFGVLRNLDNPQEILENFIIARGLLDSRGVFLVAEPRHLKIKAPYCRSLLVQAGFDERNIESRLDLRPFWSATKYYVYGCHVTPV